jgi:hypothetical protein
LRSASLSARSAPMRSARVWARVRFRLGIMSVRFALGVAGADGGAGVWAAQARKNRLLPGLVM